jgi:hypothetical protein
MTWVRSVLGALDYNLSTNTEQATRLKDGEARFKTQVTIGPSAKM